MKQRVSCLDCVSYNCFIKRFCKEDQLAWFSSLKNMNFYSRGDTLFREGNSMQGVNFIHHGAIKVVAPDPKGREQVVRLAIEGNLLGHRVNVHDTYYFNAIALTDCAVCFAGTDLFKQTCEENAEFSYNLILHYALELRRTELRVKYQAQMNIREKVAQAFLYIQEMFGINPATKCFNIKLSRIEIAEIAGTTAEQVTRQLADFEHEKLIKKLNRDICILNLPGIENVVKDYRIH